ncbi:hypothetical protein Glove_154g37 [Diversispora epigaea]|uniref:Uncharacterized protein n=1 Tax=Diversispora epigaea TaxID=1348612 RepID=A0A397IW67_9GLOM|nr:hypothetical protein Glove_154g37 [Diversispora epigaea]
MTRLFLRKIEENHTFFDEEREELIEEWPIQNIAKFGRNLVASEIRYYLEFQEYPNSLETGFASVYNVSGWDETDAKEAFSMKNIQYSYGENGTIRTIKNCEFFPDIKVSKGQRECLGVKVCEFASKELDVGHTSVDFSIPLFKKMFETDVEFHKQATIWQAYEYQCGHINNSIKCTGKPKLGEFTQTRLFLRKIEENHTFFDEEREELIEEWPIQNIAKFGRNLVASEIRYYLEFQEYPNSLETGFASVYNVSGWDETDAKEAFSMKNIQYSYGENGTIRTIKNCEFFPDIKVSKGQRECLGVKVCEFASKELDVGHTSVDFSIPLFKKMFETDVEFHKQATIWQAYEYQCGHINNSIKCTGKPKLGEFTQIISSISSKRKFIGCTNWKMGELDHRYMIIPDNVNLELLETMFNEYSYHANGIDFERDESNVIDECFMVRPNSTRSDTCSFLHKTGNHIVKGIINKKAEPCPVKFYHIIPKDLKNCPFIVTISIGIHNYPPPPPRKTPYNIKNQLQKIIDNKHILDLTTRKLLTGLMIKAYLNGKQISDLHLSLNNQSKINYYIEKTRCSQYPFGQNILGVTYEFMKHEMSTDSYIRSIRFLDNGQYIILCATKQQLKTIKELTYIEIDMAFKRIHGKTNEWEVSTYLSHVQKTLTFVRIFTNIETAEAYKNLFEDLFTCIEKDTGEIFNFYHIHGKGLGCILADQHKGQALGKL